jgi:predicted Rossmann-fold nucleotide-binding protein
MHRPLIKIGVMGSARTSITAECLQRVDELAVRLGKKIAAAACVLITGELDGIPGRVVEAHSQCGGLSVGISPASSAVAHAALSTTPPCPSCKPHGATAMEMARLMEAKVPTANKNSLETRTFP